MRLFIALLCGVVVCLSVSSLSARTWTDKAGQQITAKFVRVVGDQVVLLRGGRPLTVPFATLSDEDQRYIREQVTGEKTEPPAADPGSTPESSPTQNSPSGTTPASPSAGSEGQPGTSVPATDPADPDMRIWTDIRGGQIQAKLERFDGENVILKKFSGSSSNYKLENFSQADQEFLLAGPRVEPYTPPSNPQPRTTAGRVTQPRAPTNRPPANPYFIPGVTNAPRRSSSPYGQYNQPYTPTVRRPQYNPPAATYRQPSQYAQSGTASNSKPMAYRAGQVFGFGLLIMIIGAVFFKVIAS